MNQPILTKRPRTASELQERFLRSEPAIQALAYLLVGPDAQLLLNTTEHYPLTQSFIRSKVLWEFPTENHALLASVARWIRYTAEYHNLSLIVDVPLEEMQAFKAFLLDLPEQPTEPSHAIEDQLEDALALPHGDRLDSGSRIDWLHDAANGNKQDKKFRWAS